MNTPTKVRLAAVINSFNRLGLLQAALPSLVGALKEMDMDCAIVVFDAGSTDGSVDWLRKYAAGETSLPVELVQPRVGEDTSFSAGINAGCRHALSRFGGLEYILFFETDNWLANSKPLRQACILLCSEDRLAAVGFTVRKHSGERAGFGCPFPGVFGFAAGQQLTHRLGLDRPDENDLRESGGVGWFPCDVVFTSPLLVRRTAWDQSGGFDAAAFPFSDSDVDWAWRLHEAGWKNGVIPVTEVVHDNRETLSEWSMQRVINFHQARLRLLKRHRGAWVAAIKPILFVRHFLELFLIFCLSLLGRKNSSSIAKRRRLLGTVFQGYETTAATQKAHGT